MKNLSSCRYAVLTWLAMVLLPSLSWAANYYVDNTIPSSSNSNNGLSWNAPLLTISAALSRSQQGDTVMVAAGRYAEAVSLRKGVGLKGGYAPASQERVYNPSLYQAVIRPNTQANAEVHAVSAIGAAGASLEGFYILNGKARQGGGLYLLNCSSIIVSNNTIYSNNADNGAGIYAEDVKGSLTNNNVHDNTANKAGGGIKLQDSIMLIQGNYIERNTAAISGGGIYADNFKVPAPVTANTIIFTPAGSSNIDPGSFTASGSANATPSVMAKNKIRRNIAKGYGGGIYMNKFYALLLSNDISSNQAADGSGGGIYATGFTGSMINCLLSKNFSRIGAAIYADEFSTSNTFINNTIVGNTCGNPSATGGIYSTGINCTFTNNVFWNNGRDLFNVTGSFSNSLMNTDPLFVNPDAGDFHLQAGSPCINAGTITGAPSDDLDGITRPQLGGIDIGAYEYVAP